MYLPPELQDRSSFCCSQCRARKLRSFVLSLHTPLCGRGQDDCHSRSYFTECDVKLAHDRSRCPAVGLLCSNTGRFPKLLKSSGRTAADALGSSNGQVSENRSGAALRQSSQLAPSHLGTLQLSKCYGKVRSGKFTCSQ